MEDAEAIQRTWAAAPNAMVASNLVAQQRDGKQLMKHRSARRPNRHRWQPATKGMTHPEFEEYANGQFLIFQLWMPSLIPAIPRMRGL